MPSIITTNKINDQIKKINNFFGILFFLFLSNYSYSDDHNLNEILKLIQKDLKTLERAVYSDGFSCFK